MRRFLFTLLIAFCAMLVMAQKPVVVLGEFTPTTEAFERQLRREIPLFVNIIHDYLDGNKRLKLLSPRGKKGVEKYLAKNSGTLYDISGKVRAETDTLSNRNVVVCKVFVDVSITDLRTGELSCQFTVNGSWGTDMHEELDFFSALSYAADAFNIEMLRNQVFFNASKDAEGSIISNTVLFGNAIYFGTIATMESRDHYSEKHLRKLIDLLKKAVKKDDRIILAKTNIPDAESKNLIDLNIAKYYTVDGVITELGIDAEGERCTCSVILNFTDMRLDKVLKSIVITGQSEVKSSVSKALDEAVKACALDFENRLNTL